MSVTILQRTKALDGANSRFLPRSANQFMSRLPVLALASSLVVLSGCVNPRAEANVAQALNDAANEMAGLKNDLATLQTQLDSLREIVAKQDTVIGRLAEVNHVPR